jgi:hypothetical protein
MDTSSGGPAVEPTVEAAGMAAPTVVAAAATAEVASSAEVRLRQSGARRESDAARQCCNLRTKFDGHGQVPEKAKSQPNHGSYRIKLNGG